MTAANRPKITLDSTPISVVVLCDTCPYWTGFALSRPHGWRIGAAHQRGVHDMHHGNAIENVQQDDRRNERTLAALDLG